MSEMQVLGCLRCKRVLTRPVHPLPEMPTPELQAGGVGYDPTVPIGYVAVDPVGLQGPVEGTPGCLVVNPADGLELLTHEDPVRNSGCCAHDGMDGPNRRCPGCRSEVATLRDDCWSPHELRFEPGVVALMGVSKTWS